MRVKSMLSEHKDMLKGKRLLLLDIEGTLTPGKDVPILPEHLGILKSIAVSRRSFTIGLLTGRGIEHAIGFEQLLGKDGLIIGESGGMVYDCDTRSTINLTDARKRMSLNSAKAVLDVYVERVDGGIESKQTMLSYNPPHGVSTAGFSAALRAQLSAVSPGLLDDLEFTYSKSAVDITCKGVNKGTGLLRVAGARGIAVSDIAFMGDGVNDLAAFRVVADGGGMCLAPRNAAEEVKDYLREAAAAGKHALVLDKESTAAVLEVLSLMQQVSRMKSKERLR